MTYEKRKSFGEEELGEDGADHLVKSKNVGLDSDTIKCEEARVTRLTTLKAPRGVTKMAAVKAIPREVHQLASLIPKTLLCFPQSCIP